MDNPRVVVAGHSHTKSCGVPLLSAKGLNEVVPLDARFPGFVGLTGKWPRERSYWEELEKLSSTHDIALFWQGNQHLARFMFSPTPKLDFVLSDAPELPINEGSVIVPELAMREIFQPSLNELEKFLDKLSKRKHCSILLTASPPPKEDDNFCREHLRKEPHFVRMAEQLGVDLGKIEFSRPVLRYKHWALLQKMSRQIAQKYAVQFLPVPEGTQTKEGFLREEFWAQDVTHANGEYGRAVLAQIAAAVRTTSKVENIV